MTNSIQTSNQKKKNSDNLGELKGLSEKEEEILEYIWKLTVEDQVDSIKRLKIANMLNCSPALVNKILKSLENKGFILHKKYGELRLTDRGKNYGIALIRKHRLSEALFVDILGLEPSEAHDFACKFEHIMDIKLTNRIEELLNNPITCPHGNPIPSEKIQKQQIKGTPLSSFSSKVKVQISQILHENSDFLKKLSEIGIKVGTIVTIVEKSPLDGTLLIEINDKNLSLGLATAENLLGILVNKRRSQK